MSLLNVLNAIRAGGPTLAAVQADLTGAAFHALTGDPSVRVLAGPHVYADPVQMEVGPAVIMTHGQILSLPEDDEDRVTRHRVEAWAYGHNTLSAFLLAGTVINCLMEAKLTVAGNKVLQPRSGSARLIKRNTGDCCVAAEVVLHVQPVEGE